MIIWFFILLWSLWLLRVWLAYKFGVGLIEQVSELCSKDIIAHREWMWRYEQLNTVSYYETCFTFWKRLKAENYYKDLSFLKGKK